MLWLRCPVPEGLGDEEEHEEEAEADNNGNYPRRSQLRDQTSSQSEFTKRPIATSADLE